MAGRAPKARACSINKILYRASEAKRRRKQTARAQRESFALTRRNIYQCSITRRGKILYRASEASEDGSKRPERSEGRLHSPVGAYTSVQSPAGVPVFGASEASEDGSKRPEHERGSFALTRRGIYQCSITRTGRCLWPSRREALQALREAPHV